MGAIVELSVFGRGTAKGVWLAAGRTLLLQLLLLLLLLAELVGGCGGVVFVVQSRTTVDSSTSFIGFC